MKAQMVPILDTLSSNVVCVPLSNVTVRILDGAFIVHILQPGISKTFGDYEEYVIAKYVKSTLNKAQKIDIVFGVYTDDSLKEITRDRRETWQKRWVLPNVAIPANSKSFLSSSEHKIQLFGMLANATETTLLYMWRYSLHTVFHAFTGCGVISCFASKHNSSAWDTWQVYPVITDIVVELSSPGEIA